MADNVAQSIKNLKKNLEELDTQLLQEQNAAKKLGEMLQTAMKDAGVSVDDFVKAVRNKMNSATKANKISLVLELTDAKGKPLTAASIQSEISALTSSGKNPIRLNELKELQKIMGDPAKFYDELMRMVNKMNGSKKSSASSEWKEMTRLNNQLKKSILDTKNAIDKQTESISRQKSELSRLQSLLQRQKSGIVGIDYKSEESKTRAIAKTNAQIKKTEENIRAAEQEVERLNKKLGQTESRTKNVEQNTKNLKTSFADMLPTLRHLAAAFGVAFSVQGLVQFGKKLVETRGEFELQQVALRSILQNKQLADEIWDKTMNAALQSPFRAMQLTKYTKQLAAYRIETDKLFDTTKRLADVSAGLGVDMQRLILAYGQVKAANYLRASEIRQFTEAGVNILGELSKYFTDIQGKTVSTAQVMDMVQKRMVKFEAVEEIFKRMTDQGGIFYEMQYIQSQTVKGQINKLHDAYDQMLNSIGKSNEGVIKNGVALLNNMVKNWREWKTVLDAIAWPLIISSVAKLGKGLFTVGSSARLAAGELKGLELIGTKIRNIIGQTNPWMLLATAITTATFALINHNKAVKAVQKEIDEQNLRIYETREQFTKYHETLEANNEAIKKGSLAEKELKEKRKENRDILSKLQNDYPQIAKNLEEMRDGTIKNTEALKNYNDELERQMTLNNMLGMGGGWMSDTLKTNMQQWETDLSQLKGELISMQSIARLGIMKLHLEGKDDGPLAVLLKEINSLDLSNVVEASKKYNEILSKIKNLMPYTGNITGIGVGGAVLPEYLQGLISTTTFPHDTKQVDRKQNIEFDRFITNLENEFDTAVLTISDYSKKISEEYEGDVLKFISANTDLINQGVKDGNADVVKNIRTVLQTAGIGLTQESRNFYNKLLNERIRYLAVQEQLKAQEGASITSIIQAYKKYENIDFFAAPAGSTTTSPLDDGKNKGAHEAQKMISLLKEMNSEYMKLSKSAYGFAKSNDKVKESFEKAFAEVFKVRGGTGTYIDYNNVDITSKQGLANALQSLYDELAKTNSFAKFGKTFEQELLKAIGTAKVEVDIELTTRTRENVAKQLEEAFGDYQLTLDLQKLQLPSGLLTDMFDIDAVDLAGMRQKLEDLSKKLVDKNGVMTGDNLKLYEDWLKKLDDEERKLQQQRLKDYSKYLEYQLSDRAKLEMEYVKKVAEVQSEVAFDDTTRQRILDGLRKEYDEKLAKQDWEDFKGSEMYVEMMEDLTKQGTAALEEMRKKLLEVRDNAENLSPRALKEVIKALEKIDETVYGRMSPFQAVRELRKQARGAMNENGVLNVSEAFERDRAAKEEYEERRKLHEAIEENIADRQKEADLEEQIGEKGSRNIDALREYLEIAREQKKAAEEHRDLLGEENKENQEEYQKTLHEIENWSIQIEQYQNRINLLTKLQSIQDKIAKSEYSDISLEDLTKMSKEELDAMGLSEEEMKNMGEILKYWKLMRQAEIKALEEVKNYLSIIQSIGKNTADMLHTFGVEQNPLSDYWEQATDSAFNYAQQTIDAIKQFKEAATAATAAGEALATGNYIKLALQLLGVLIQLINQIGLFRNARINKEIEDQKEKIDQLTMAYDRLEKSIERTLSTSGYMANMHQMVVNIREQIEATEQQLALARSRKSVDNDEVRGYEKSLQDLYDQLDEVKQKQIEVFGGVGKDNYRSWAEGFVSAWKDAFLETGDGLDALQDHFDEFLQEWFVKQATMRIATKALKSIMTQIDESVSGGDVDLNRLWQIKEQVQSALEQLNIDLTEFAGMWNLGGEGGLSGLAAGIQGMTEEQANILEAYWNSVRMYTANINDNVARIASMLGVGGAETNPMLQQMSIIAENTAYIKSIYTMLDNSQRNLGQGKGFVTYQL